MDYIPLSCGDMVVDPKTKENGVLFMRFDVMAAYNSVSSRPVWAWDIWWSGSKAADDGGARIAYTEEGLLNMIRMGTFDHIKK